MAEPKVTIPHAIGWSAFTGAMVFLVTATWASRGAYAELQAVRESAAATATEQREMKNQMWLFKEALTKSDERMEWIIRALERQERREGYQPPPPPPSLTN